MIAACIRFGSMYALKKKLHQALESNDLETVVALVKENRKVLSLLVRAAYDKETLVGWRAIKALGLSAQALVGTDYDFLRETVRKLLWSLSDESGGIGWAAPELLGEIVSADPQRFNDIIPLIAEVYDIEEKVFRPGILYALGKIAEKSPDLVMPYKDFIRRALSGGGPLSRVFALDLLKTLKSRLGKEDMDNLTEVIQSLLSDHSEAWVYKNDRFINVEIGEYARSFLS
jgi:hypothetical protein